MIEIKDLTKQYGSTPVLYNLNFQIYDGEIFGLLGPNGAGKTTLLNILSTLSKPTDGTVLIEGHDVVKDKDVVKHKIGYMTDEPLLYDKLTAVEFLEFVGILYGIEKGDLNNRIQRLLELTNLKEKSEYLIETYSFGMKKKLSFAASVIHKPKVIILDEPFNGLDPESSYVLKSLLKSFKKRGNTIILATHILEVAELLCDRVGIINKGKLVLLEKVEDLHKKYENKELEEVFLEVTGRDEGYKDLLESLKKNEENLTLF
ncbi:MAG: ABC transporter ATP-binding protein [Caldisericum sp.]|jgi:ABC-2 type transport system ATP-binding protein|nr:ABC transporter ATP-binding protein [Caldisericum sp.]